jgi:hypothetical protein
MTWFPVRQSSPACLHDDSARVQLGLLDLLVGQHDSAVEEDFILQRMTQLVSCASATKRCCVRVHASKLMGHPINMQTC